MAQGAREYTGTYKRKSRSSLTAAYGYLLRPKRRIRVARAWSCKHRDSDRGREIHTEYLSAGAQAIKTNTTATTCVYPGMRRSSSVSCAQASDTPRVRRSRSARISLPTSAPSQDCRADVIEEYYFLADSFLAAARVTSSLRQTLPQRGWSRQRHTSSRSVLMHSS